MNAREDFLAQIMGNSARARVLRALMQADNEVFTAENLGKRARLSSRTTARELSALRALKIVRSSKASLPAPTVVAASVKRRTAVGMRAKRKPETVWFLDPHFPHLRALSSFVHAVSPVQHGDVLQTLKRSGKLSAVVLSGFFVGDASRPADILVAGEQVNQRRLEGAMKSLEPLFGREVRYAAFSTPEFRYRLTVQDRLVRDTLDFPHVVLLDRARLF